MPTTTAYIALGSNLGDRRAALDAALEHLRQHPGVAVTRVSSYHETEPVGGPSGQDKYLNAVAELHTELTARELLQALLAVEQRLGRVRAERFGPRTIDLDLLLFGHEVHDVREPGLDLTVPHPRLHERAFVLAPLVEIAPLAVHPVLGSTATDLLRALHRPARELAGQTAVVTGSTSGIGRATALELAAAGANVVVHGRRSADAAEAVARECRSNEVQAHTAMADLRDEGACLRLIDEVWGRSPVDVWVNNAGADIVTGEGARLDFLRKLEELWLVDVRATMLISREVGRRMKERGRGVILNIGWDQAETGTDLESGQLFGATKGAVMAFTRSLALSLAPEVRVNCVAPGWIKTAWGQHASQPWHDRVRRETPLLRWGTPEDVAQATRWLASPAAAFLTGQTIRVNGGAVR